MTTANLTSLNEAAKNLPAKSAAVLAAIADGLYEPHFTDVGDTDLYGAAGGPTSLGGCIARLREDGLVRVEHTEINGTPTTFYSMPQNDYDSVDYTQLRLAARGQLATDPKPTAEDGIRDQAAHQLAQLEKLLTIMADHADELRESVLDADYGVTQQDARIYGKHASDMIEYINIFRSQRDLLTEL